MVAGEHIDSKVKKQRWSAPKRTAASVYSHQMTYDRFLKKCGWLCSWDKSMLVCHYRDRALHVKCISVG